MESYNPLNEQFETDPHQEALEEVAFTAWQFTAAMGKLRLSEDFPLMRLPKHEEWKRARELVDEYGIASDEIVETANCYNQEFLEAIYPDDGLEFFQKYKARAIRHNKQLRARITLHQALSRRLFS